MLWNHCHPCSIIGDVTDRYHKFFNISEWAPILNWGGNNFEFNCLKWAVFWDLSRHDPNLRPSVASHPQKKLRLAPPVYLADLAYLAYLRVLSDIPGVPPVWCPAVDYEVQQHYSQGPHFAVWSILTNPKWVSFLQACTKLAQEQLPYVIALCDYY